MAGIKMYVIVVESLDGGDIILNKHCFSSYKCAKAQILKEPAYKEVEDLGVFEGTYTRARILSTIFGGM